MATRRTRRTAATSEVTEEVVTIETRSSKRTRGGTRKTATSKTTSKAQREVTPQPDTTPNARASAQTTTRAEAVAATPAPATATKRRLRSTQPEAASPLRALDEQPAAKRPKTSSKKAAAPRLAPAKPEPVQEEDDEETGIFFSKSFDLIASELARSSLEARIATFEATCNSQQSEISQLRSRITQLEQENRDLVDLYAPKTSPAPANSPTLEFDSFDVDQSEPAPAYVTGSESAIALLRHVQEASRIPEPTTPTPEVGRSPTPEFTVPVASEQTPTPSRSLFGSFTSPFTAIKKLFGSSTPLPSSPTPSRPQPNSITEVLSMPPTPVGERAKRPGRRAKKSNRLVRALLNGVDAQDTEKATAWATRVAAELGNNSTAGDKRKRLETPVLYRDLKHLPSSKPWQSGFSFPEDVLDLEDDDVVPAWAVYTSMIEEEQHQPKRTKNTHAAFVDDELPASLNELFGTSTASWQDMTPRRSIDPSPMFDTPLHHQEGGNVFNELRGHDAAVTDREKLQHELKTANSQRQTEVKTRTPSKMQTLPRVHDPIHGSFSVPDSDSEEELEEEVATPPLWTHAPPPAPTPSHTTLPTTGHNEEVERQRQKLMKHTPHKPSRLQQVSYPSPSLRSDAGDSILAASPAKFSELFGAIPQVEPLMFGDAEIDAAVAAASTPEAIQARADAMNWSPLILSYDSDEEELSPV